MSTKTTQPVTGSGCCLCGCGQIVSTMGKSRFRPGHDARAAGNAARHYLETGDDALIRELPSDALQRKANGMVQRAHDKAQAKQARQDAKTAPVLDVDPVKVGRWSYPARTVGGKLQRNERRDGSGAWVAVA